MFERALSKSFQIEESSGIDWFAGRLTVQGLSSGDMKELIAAIRARKEHLRLKNGAWLNVRSLNLEKLLKTIDSLGLKLRADGSLPRISRAHAAALFLSHEREVSFPEKNDLHRFLERLRACGPENGPPFVPTRRFRGTLRPYQEEGGAFLRRLFELESGGILADDMGLGKTVQALAFLDRARESSGGESLSLVVGPLAALGVWAREAERFCPHIPLRVFHGPDRKKEPLPSDGLILTTFATAGRDISLLEELKFELLFIDEAQFAKNHRTDIHRNLLRLSVRSAFCLTGTPLENNIGELWAVMELCFPGLLGTRTAFRRFLRSDESLDSLRKRLAPFLLRRRKEDVLRELPPRTEREVTVPMTKRQAALYEQARREAVRDLALAGRDYLMKMLPHLMRLRRIACHPRLDDPERTDPKLSGKLAHLAGELEEILRASSGVIVFSQFTDVLRVTGRLLTDAGIDFHYIDGKTKQSERERQTEEFQAGGGKHFFLVSLRAGGTALTLHRADTVIHLDPWWNPAVERQATDRAHRIGQKRPVYVLRLRSQGTVEEKVSALQQKKRKLFDRLLESGFERAADVSREDIMALLQPPEGA